MDFSSLPTDVLRYLSQYLTWIDLYHLAQSNKRLRQSFFNPYLDHDFTDYICSLIRFGYRELLSQYSTKLLFSSSDYIKAFAWTTTIELHKVYREYLIYDHNYICGIIQSGNNTIFNLNIHDWLKIKSKISIQRSGDLYYRFSVIELILTLGNINMINQIVILRLIDTKDSNNLRIMYVRGIDYIKLMDPDLKYKHLGTILLHSHYGHDTQVYPWYMKHTYGEDKVTKIFEETIEWLKSK